MEEKSKDNLRIAWQYQKYLERNNMPSIPETAPSLIKKYLLNLFFEIIKFVLKSHLAPNDGGRIAMCCNFDLSKKIKPEKLDICKIQVIIKLKS